VKAISHAGRCLNPTLSNNTSSGHQQQCYSAGQCALHVRHSRLPLSSARALCRRLEGPCLARPDHPAHHQLPFCLSCTGRPVRCPSEGIHMPCQPVLPATRSVIPATHPTACCFMLAAAMQLPVPQSSLKAACHHPKPFCQGWQRGPLEDNATFRAAPFKPQQR